ncbi:hypothetical protein [Pseudoruegeria sp. SHC-113]|uniref:head-tail connector protein n=1 Tax=Pseudoruegeria sp. SHC-113 TaxID=2855439 RepID=UPI0021BB53E1|nr:hypothetical protein [Pseudoruegeria sp. SHC-113]MCT8160119.1 hypothetical protein [Pseudoruegeria sp. SHC-113]
MKLSEVTAIADANLPLAGFREFLRLGTGFSDDGLQDDLLLACLRAALASVEARTGKAVYAREFIWVTNGWRALDAQCLPVAPVSALLEMNVRDRTGAVEPVDLARFALVQDMQRPRLEAVSGSLPSIPTGGQAELRFTAGFSPAWAELPADLRQAIFALAAFFYENRTPDGGGGAWPTQVNGLLAPYFTVRLFGGNAQ